jgi:hypothetical protein
VDKPYCTSVSAFYGQRVTQKVTALRFKWSKAVDYSIPPGDPVATAVGPPPAGRTTLQQVVRKVLSSRSGGSRFVQNLYGPANLCDAENQHWHIRTCLASAIGVVNVDIGFGQL